MNDSSTPGISMGLEDSEDPVISEVSELSLDSLMPSSGAHFSLDPSKTSSGYALWAHGELVVGTIQLPTFDGPHWEVQSRRELKRLIESILVNNGITSLTTLLIEDVHFGAHPDTIRLLLALNSAVDELILDGLPVENFSRINNKSWKSWLKPLLGSVTVTGLDDKVKVREALHTLGLHFTGEGFQDLYDASGILLGYFISLGALKNVDLSQPTGRITFSDVVFLYMDHEEDLFDELSRRGKTLSVELTGRFYESKILQNLYDNPNAAYVYKKPVSLGFFGERHGLEPIQGGGYFAYYLDLS